MYKINRFKYKREEGQNPYIGFTSFQHFNGEKLYSDSIVRPENNLTETEPFECYPVPDDVEENGREQGFYPDSSVAYIRILWKEFEPERGVYNYKFIEDIIKEAREHNQTLVFRLLPHSTRARDDVPQWLKELIPCPERPDGKRVKDSPTDPLFLKYFCEAVRKIGERFDHDPTFEAIDISLPGSWGEGHNLHLYSQEALNEIVDTYLDVFKETQLMTQLMRSELIGYANKKTNVGWRGDGLGEPRHISEFYPPNIAKVSENWRKAPVSFEAYWWLGEWKRKGWDIDDIIEKTLKWHISSFNGKSLPIPYEWKDKIDYWISKMGYHFMIDYFKYPEIGHVSNTLKFELGIENCGVAPIYRHIPFKVRLSNEENFFEFDTQIDIRRWMPGKYTEEITLELPENFSVGGYNIEIGIMTNPKSGLYFCTDAMRNGYFYKVGEIILRSSFFTEPQKDFCKYADVFYGNGEVDHFADDGLASKWFYIKALCGNTNPHAVYPFGKISVGAYSGGYPTGYGNHYPNGCGGIQKMCEDVKIRGFSHLHQSGTGAIGYYYNYAITTPFYGSINQITNYYTAENECGHPGYYSVEFNDILCELTVNEHTAFHHYHYKKEGGRAAIDFSNDGLSRLFSANRYTFAGDAEVELTSSNYVFFSGVLSGIKLYFCAFAEGKNVRNKLFFDTRETDTSKLVIEDSSKPFGVIYDFDGDEILIKVSYSTLGYEQAKANLDTCCMSFEEAANKANMVWNETLSAIDIQTTDEELKEKFYSNFYHSIIKPCDMTGESIMGIHDDLVADLATVWDQYKTLYPLIYMLYPDMGNKIVRAFGNISRTLGKIPCSLGISNIFSCEEQAKMLGILTLCDAYYFGIESADQKLISECIQRELEREDYKIFLASGIFERYTHILDTTDACLAAADITEDKELENTLRKLAENWVNAYDVDGLMSVNSPYYEGDRYTYSFRLQKNMEERIALAGGKEAFVRLLDDFFGFHKVSLKQLTHIGADEEIAATQAQHHRFEGFNNECDMETPYAYIYADRHDRTCDIVRESIYKSFTTGKGALPGNNDSGGLSSCFLWNVLGLFPVSGRGEFLLGKPYIDKATITLSNGNLLVIENLNKENQYVNNVKYNDQEITNYRISINQLMQGGRLTFS